MERRSTARVAFLGCALATAACGPVQFVPAPFTPLAVELAYSPVEDLTRLRWRVGDVTALHFELAGATAGSFSPIDFTTAPFASGQYACTGGVCFQLVLRGRKLPPASGPLVRSRQDTFGVFPGASAVAAADVTSPVTLVNAVTADDASVVVTVTDWLSAPPLARRFRYTVWAEPDGVCAPDASLPDAPTEVFAGSKTLPFTAPFSEAGRYCARVRPEPADAVSPAAFVAPLWLLPSVFRQEIDYQPKPEVSPIVWRLVEDLEISDPDRCSQVEDGVRQLLTGTIESTGAVAAELDPVELSPGCQQDPDRALDAASVADDTKSDLAIHYTNQYQRPLLFYVNNLDAPLPPALATSFATYQSAFPDVHVQPLDVAIAYPSVSAGGGWDATIQYADYSDAQFVASIASWVTTMLPFVSQLHDPTDIIPLLSPATLATATGGQWKICQASPSINRVQGTTVVDSADLAPPVDPSAPPGFQVQLPEKILVPSKQFKSDTAIVRVELCLHYCDNPFVDEAGGMHASWQTAAECVRNSVP